MSGQRRQTWTRWLPRFSMRTGLILFLVLGTGLGLAARYWQDIRERGDAQKWLAGRGSLGQTSGDALFVNYAPEQPRSWFVSLVRKWVHPEYDRRIHSISVSGAGLTEEAAKKIARVYAVDSIMIDGPVSEASLATIVAAPGLESLSLNGVVSPVGAAADWTLLKRASQLNWLGVGSECQIPESAAIELGKLPNLKTVVMNGRDLKAIRALATVEGLVEFRMEGRRGPKQYSSVQGEVNPIWNQQLGEVLDELAKRSKLKRLRLLGSDFNDPAILTNFAETSNLKILHLERDFITPECLAEFAKLKKIETLHLQYTPIGNEHLRILAGMKTLYGIHGLLEQSEAELRALEAALPHCKVNPPY